MRLQLYYRSIFSVAWQFFRMKHKQTNDYSIEDDFSELIVSTKKETL